MHYLHLRFLTSFESNIYHFHVRMNFVECTKIDFEMWEKQSPHIKDIFCFYSASDAMKTTLYMYVEVKPIFCLDL